MRDRGNSTESATHTGGGREKEFELNGFAIPGRTTSGPRRLNATPTRHFVIFPIGSDMEKKARHSKSEKDEHALG